MQKKTSCVLPIDFGVVSNIDIEDPSYQYIKVNDEEVQKV